MRGSRDWVRDHARLYMSERLGAGAADRAGDMPAAVDPNLRRLFERTYPRGRLRATEPAAPYAAEERELPLFSDGDE